jgi:hypothetical protein
VYDDEALPGWFDSSMACVSSSKHNIFGKATVSSKII